MSSGVIGVSFEIQSVVTSIDFSFVLEYKKLTSSGTQDVSHTFSTFSKFDKTLDLSFYLSSAVGNDTPAGDLSLVLYQGDTKKWTVTISNEKIYDLPRELNVLHMGTGTTSTTTGSSRFGIQMQSPSGDLLRQDRDLDHQRILRLDLSGSRSGFPSTHTLSSTWIQDVSFSTKGTTPTTPSDWLANIDKSGNVIPSTGTRTTLTNNDTTAHYEIALSGEAIFDASHLWVTTHLKVPKSTSDDVSLVTHDLSMQIGNIARLQKIELLEYETGAGEGGTLHGKYRTIYDTPDVIYVNSNPTNNSHLYRQRGGNAADSIADISYFIAGRDYYFFEEDARTITFSSGSIKKGKMHKVKNTNGTTVTIGNAGTSITSVPVLVDISFGPSHDPGSSVTNKTAKFIGRSGDVDVSSTMQYRFTFSHPKPKTEFSFNKDPTQARLELSGSHIVASGAAGKKNVTMMVNDETSVDLSFVIGVDSSTKDISLEDLFVTTNLDRAYPGYNFGSVSGPELPNIVYPNKLLHTIPSAFNDLNGDNVLASSGDSIATSYKNLYTNTYGMTSTFFDVNQPTNYVEISLNQPLPSTVSAEWFKDVSFMEYSTYTGSSTAIPESAWTSVSFDRAANGILTEKQTVAFSICGECLNSHNLYLRQHVVLYDPEKGEYDVSFVKDFSDHLMKQPVFKKLEILDHRDMTFKDPKDVSYVVNMHNAILNYAGDENLNWHNKNQSNFDKNGDWSKLSDLSCVARIYFEEPGVGRHNSIVNHYDFDVSMTYDFSFNGLRRRKYLSSNTVETGKKDVAFVDICGTIQDNITHSDHIDVSLSDLSFSINIKRKNATNTQYLDVSNLVSTFSLNASQIWQMPTDVSFVKARTLSGDIVAGTQYEYADTSINKFTNKFPGEISYNHQRIYIDFSGGYFPTNKTSDWIVDVSYSTKGNELGTTASTHFRDFVDMKQSLLVDVCNEILPAVGSDGRLRRLYFDISSDAILFDQFYVQFRLKGPNEKYYHIVKTFDEYVDAKLPNQHLTVWPTKSNQANWKNVLHTDSAHVDSYKFVPKVRSDRTTPSVISNTLVGYFTQFEDASLSIVRKSSIFKNFDKNQNLSDFDISFSVRYQTYDEYVRRETPGSGLVPLKQLRIYNADDISLGSFMKWQDLSKGIIDGIIFRANDLSHNQSDGGVFTQKDFSSEFLSSNILSYQPPRTTDVIDGSMQITNIANSTLPQNTSLNAHYPGKKISFMASGELDFNWDGNWEISFGMLPDVIPGKHEIQRVVKQIDISYNGTNNSIGLIGYNIPNNDVSCIPGKVFESTAGGESVNTVDSILMNFDASANAAAIAKYQPHVKPTSDLSINLTFYTDLTHSDTDISVITWTIPAANIDWLNPPTKSERMEAKKLAGNSTIKNLGDTKDMSWTNVFDTSMTVILDQKFHKFFRYRYSGDTSGMIIDASLVWAHYTDDATKTRRTDEVNIASAIKTVPDASYVQFDISWQDFSKGVPITTDPSSLFFTMRVHNRREAIDAEYNDISFGISGENIRFYSAPTKMLDISCLYGASKTPLTDHSMTMLYGLDQCLNLVFDPSAFGHVYLPEFGTKAHPWQPDISYVIKEISYSWLHQEPFISMYTKGSNDASFVDRTVYGNRDVIQVSLLNRDISNAYGQVRDIKPDDPSAMHISIALYQDRALTDSLVKCISMNIPWSDVSSAGNPPPSKVVKIEARHTVTDFSFSIYGGGTVPDVNTEISFNVTVDNSFTPLMGSVSSDYIKHDMGIKYRWKPWEDATGIKDKWHDTGVSDISISLNSKTMSFKLDASNILHTGRIFEASANLFDISLQFYNTPGDAAKGVVDASLGTKAPGHNDIHANQYPTQIKDVSYSIKNVHQTDKSFNMIVDSSFAVRVNDVSAEFFTTSKYGKTWSVSADYVKDASVTVIPGAGTPYSFDLCTNHMAIEDASRIEVRLSVNDVSRGVMNDEGRVEISFNFYTDLSGTQSQMTHIVIPGIDISAYQPPSAFVPTSTKASWTGDATPKYFTDSSLSLWYNKDISLTLQFNKPFHPLTSVSSDVIFDLSYIHDFCGNNITTSNESLKSTIDISDDNLRYLTVRLKKEDLSAGIPLDRVTSGNYNTGSGRKDISFVARVYRDWAKTEALATDVSFAINERDISYYHPPCYFSDFKTQTTINNNLSIDVSSQLADGKAPKHANGTNLKLISLVDSSLNLTISSGYINSQTVLRDWNSYGFPSTVYNDWIKDICMSYQGNSAGITSVFDAGTGEIKPTTDGSNLIIQIGMNDTLKSTYLNNVQFHITMYNDRSKHPDRVHVAKTKIYPASEISQNADPTHFISIQDQITTYPLPDTALTIRKRGADPTVNLTFTLNAPVDSTLKYGINDNLTRLEYKIQGKPEWHSAGLTRNNLPISDANPITMNADKTTFDISLDPRPILWAYNFPNSKSDADLLDFSMHIFDNDNNTPLQLVDDFGTSELLKDRHIDYFFVNTGYSANDKPDISTSNIIGGSLRTGHKISIVRDSSINITPSSEYYDGAGNTYYCPLYFEDISYHVKDISWVYTYNDGTEKTISKYYELSANKLTNSKTGTRENCNWWIKDIKAKTVDVKFDGKDASGLQFGMFDVSMDLSKGTPVYFDVKMNVYNDLSYTRGGRTVTQVSKRLVPADIEHYVFPKSIMDISYTQASNGAQDPYSATYKFSNLYDLSVNFDLSFGPTYADGEQDFTKHPLWGSTDATRLSSNFIKDLSFQWNNGPWKRVYTGAQIQNTDISLVSGKRIEFRVDQNDISTYPVQGISFNILFYKDVAKTQTYLADVSKAYTQSEISSVTLPTKITSFKALSSYAAPYTEYTDCSLSLVDQPGGMRNWAMCRLKLDRPLDSSMQVRFDFPDVAGRRTRGITYDVSMDTAGFYFSSLTAKKLEDLSSVGISNEHGAASGANAGKVDYTGPQMYEFGPQMTDISVNGDTIDFSLNVGHVLMGLNQESFKYDKDMSAVQFRVMFDTKSTARSGTRTNPGDISTGDISFTAPFTLYYRDISMYDGSGILDPSNFKVGEGGFRTKAVEWGGGELAASFEVVKDMSLEVFIPTGVNYANSRYSFKFKKPTPDEALDLSMIVQDICVNYPQTGHLGSWQVSKCISGSELEGRVIHTAPPKIEFKVPRQMYSVASNADISIVIHYKTDVCGNDMFRTGANSVIEASYVIPGYGVQNFAGFNEPTSVQNWQNDVRLTNSSVLLSNKRATMREDFSFNVVFTYPVDASHTDSNGAFQLKTNSNDLNEYTFRDVSNHVKIDDISYAWNSKKYGTPEWIRLSQSAYVSPSCEVFKTSASTTDICFQMRIPAATAIPFLYGDLSINMFVRGAKDITTASNWKLFNLHIPEADICGNELTLRLDETTISGDKTTNKIHGYYLDPHPYHKLLQIKFPTSKELGISYETNASDQGFLSSKGHGPSDYDLSTVALEADMSWGEIWKKDYRMRGLLYTGRCSNSANAPLVSFRGNNNPYDLSIGMIAGLNSVNVHNWFECGVSDDMISINDSTKVFTIDSAVKDTIQVSQNEQGTNYKTNAIKPGNDASGEIKMILSFKESSGVDISDIVIGHVGKTWTINQNMYKFVMKEKVYIDVEGIVNKFKQDKSSETDKAKEAGEKAIRDAIKDGADADTARKAGDKALEKYKNPGKTGGNPSSSDERAAVLAKVAGRAVVAGVKKRLPDGSSSGEKDHLVDQAVTKAADAYDADLPVGNSPVDTPLKKEIATAAALAAGDAVIALYTDTGSQKITRAAAAARSAYTAAKTKALTDGKSEEDAKAEAEAAAAAAGRAVVQGGTDTDAAKAAEEARKAYRKAYDETGDRDIAEKAAKEAGKKYIQEKMDGKSDSDAEKEAEKKGDQTTKDEKEAKKERGSDTMDDAKKKTPIIDDEVRTLVAPKLELTKGANVNWVTKSPLFEVSRNALLTFDISSDTSLNLIKMKSDTYFTVDISGPAHIENHRLVLAAKKNLDAEVAAEKAKRPDLTVKGVSFEVFGAPFYWDGASDASGSLRFILMQDHLGNYGEAGADGGTRPYGVIDQSYSFKNFKGYNVTDASDGNSYTVDICMNLPWNDDYERMEDRTSSFTVTFENPS